MSGNQHACILLLTCILLLVRAGHRETDFAESVSGNQHVSSSSLTLPNLCQGINMQIHNQMNLPFVFPGNQVLIIYNIYVYVCVCECVSVRVCVHTHTHTHTHIYVTRTIRTPMTFSVITYPCMYPPPRSACILLLLDS